MTQREIVSKEQTLLKALRLLLAELSPARRRTIVPLMALMVVGAFAELFSLGAVVMFLSTIADPGKLPGFSILTSLIPTLSCATPSQLIVMATLVFAVTVLAAGALRLILQRQTLNSSKDFRMT